MSDRLPPPPPDVKRSKSQPAAQSLGTPLDFRHGGASGGDAATGNPTGPPPPAGDDAQTPATGPKKAATETLAKRAGALSDEIDFPDFVASLVHGTFDAIVDAAIRQMESYADLVSAVAKSVEQFTEDNVTPNQARDWLVQQYPQDLALDLSGPPKVIPKPAQGEDADQPRSPDWLREFQLEGEELTPELIEEQLVPRARSKVGQGRQQMLATMVLLGLNRVVVRDGTISARLRFRASAADTAKVEYAVSDDPQGGSSWGSRGNSGYALPSTKVSTVGVNVQSDSELNAELFGEVKINFASETLPLERFADEAKRTLLERRAKTGQAATQSAKVVSPAPPPIPVGSAPAVAPPPVVPPAPVSPQPSAPPRA
jgi:hypothetical protein